MIYLSTVPLGGVGDRFLFTVCFFRVQLPRLCACKNSTYMYNHVFFDIPKQIYKTQKSRSCLQRTICLTLPQILHWEHLYQAETVKQNQTKSVHRYEEKKITQRQSNKTKQKFCRGRSLLGQVLPTMVYGLRKEEARAAAILCPLLAALLSLCNTT